MWDRFPETGLLVEKSGIPKLSGMDILDDDILKKSRGQQFSHIMLKSKSH